MKFTDESAPLRRGMMMAFPFAAACWVALLAALVSCS